VAVGRLRSKISIWHYGSPRCSPPTSKNLAPAIRPGEHTAAVTDLTGAGKVARSDETLWADPHIDHPQRGLIEFAWGDESAFAAADGMLSRTVAAPLP
jgi:hypothetical protein